MSKVKTEIELDCPTIIVKLTPDGLKVSLEGWQHKAPTRLLAGLEIAVQRAIHQWRARFVARDTKFGTPNLTAQSIAAEQADTERRT
jgi:hypothetical protein